jgi:hypothetical protein
LPYPGDFCNGALQLQALDLQVENPLRLLRRRRIGLGGKAGGALGEDHRMRGGKVGRKRFGRRHHAPD